LGNCVATASEGVRLPQVTRRGWIAGLGALALPCAATAEPYPWPLGVQLWSVKEELERDFTGTLRRLAALGYRRLEAAGWHGRTPAAFRGACEAAGLVCDSAHVSLPELHAEPERRIGEVRDAGCTLLVVSSPMPSRPLPAGVDWIDAVRLAMSAEDWRQNAGLLDRYAALAAKAGLQFGYHNHPAEFALFDERRGFDLLLAGTDPERVRFELDVAWAAAGGVDPTTLLRAHAGRFTRLHLKDVPRLPPPGQMLSDYTTLEVGAGVLPWPAVITAARAAGVTGAYVEVEAPYRRPVFDILASSRDYLQRLA